MRDLSSITACIQVFDLPFPTRGPKSESACQIPFTRGDSKARRSLTGSAPPCGNGFALTHRSTVEYDSSPSSTTPSSTSLWRSSLAPISGCSARLRSISAPSSSSILRLVPRSERPLGMSASKPPARYRLLQLASVAALTRRWPSGISTGDSETLLK